MQTKNSSVEAVVATLQRDSAHRRDRGEIRHTLRVSWLLCLRAACDLDDGAYMLTEDNNHVWKWGGGDFEHGINWDLVHCHYELLVCARLYNIDINLNSLL